MVIMEHLVREECSVLWGDWPGALSSWGGLRTFHLHQGLRDMCALNKEGWCRWEVVQAAQAACAKALRQEQAWYVQGGQCGWRGSREHGESRGQR